MPAMAVVAAEVFKKVRRLGVFGETLVAGDEICSIESCWTSWSGSNVISKDLFLKRERKEDWAGTSLTTGIQQLLNPVSLSVLQNLLILGI